MSCSHALRLFDIYQQALIAFHEARTRFPAAADHEGCFAEARRARAAYWKHLEEHGCRTPAEGEDSGKIRILIVDDEYGIRKLLAAAFSKAGYDVRTAAQVSEAIEVMRAEPIDAVLSDVVMNSLSGHDLMRWIAAHRPEVICVLMTAYDEVGCDGCPFANGCTLIRKPFQPKEAVAAVEQALSA